MATKPGKSYALTDKHQIPSTIQRSFGEENMAEYTRLIHKLETGKKSKIKSANKGLEALAIKFMGENHPFPQAAGFVMRQKETSNENYIEFLIEQDPIVAYYDFFGMDDYRHALTLAISGQFKNADAEFIHAYNKTSSPSLKARIANRMYDASRKEELLAYAKVGQPRI